MQVSGFTVALIRLVMPKTPPRKAPFFGPSRSDARITGMCSVVALVNPRGIYPRNGVNAIRIISAANSAT